MPYKTVKQNCTRSDGKKGKYILKYKPKKPTKKKKDSEGFVKAGCHTSKKNASGQRAAIEGGPRESIESMDLNSLLAEIDKIEEDSTPHLASYKAPEGSKRDKQLDQTKEDLKKAKDLKKKGKPGEAKELEQRAYKRRDRMERQHREKNENLIREMVRKILMEDLSKATEDKIRKKAKERGYTFGSMKAEYKKGLAAFASSGSRPGMTAHGWAMARINKCTQSQKWSGCKKSKAKKK
tara:strand:- start:13615 stop:14325 length:711 start_codon:yes stop_codon:yes gene_type:complete